MQTQTHEDFKSLYKFEDRASIIKQYLDIKYHHQDKLLLFRVGEFYEAFFEDAIKISNYLVITLTKKSSVESCGIPASALSKYIPKILLFQEKLAIAEQVEGCKTSNSKVIERKVTRIITQGTIFEDEFLDQKSNNYLLSIFENDNNFHIAYVDISTGEFIVSLAKEKDLLGAIQIISPREVLSNQPLPILEKLGISFEINEDLFNFDQSQKNISEFYQKPPASIKGIKNYGTICAVGSILAYILQNMQRTMFSLSEPKCESHDMNMFLDSSTISSLELIETKLGKKSGSLFWLLDKTSTPGGARLLRKSILSPFNKLDQIIERQEFTKFFFEYQDLSQNFSSILTNFGDMERSLTKIIQKQCSFFDLFTLKNALSICSNIKDIVFEEFGTRQGKSKIIDYIQDGLKFPYEIMDLLESAICDDDIQDISIKSTHHPRLLELKKEQDISWKHIQKLKEKYRKETNIESLKISQNNIVGIFVEINAKDGAKLSKDKFLFKQSTASTIRYKTSELIEAEKNIASCSASISLLENEIFLQICDEVSAYKNILKNLALIISRIDLHLSLARIARENNYVMPGINESDEINICNGRHPVSEHLLQKKEQNFAANSTQLNKEKSTIILTGPNMGGKSTYLKQTALMVILAQMGSFVPAEFCNIGIVDKIFFHIGGGDNIKDGKSSFMVEMEGVSMLLANATNRSLVLFDESFRGTSTEDGIVIAWAVVEELSKSIKCKSLFATHYTELAHFAQRLDCARNLQAEIVQKGDEISFSHKIKDGIAPKSLGLNVAKMAGISNVIIERAKELMNIPLSRKLGSDW
ncbi:MAG: DNA mismatch repair protein MutS [Rickettsiaceae bacterium]|nr:DNA mismatch repair protein MutS [Rickettsiaceae bacterium]